MTDRQAVLERLRRIPGIHTMPTKQRVMEIRLALMDIEGEDPDNMIAIDAIDKQLGRVLPRIKHAIGISDEALAEILGKARPTIQAYVIGRLPEKFSKKACEDLIRLAKNKIEDLRLLIDDLERIARHAKS